MGNLSRHTIGAWQRDYRLRYFVETGLWKGDGLRHALKHRFDRCYSIEANPEFVAAGNQRLEQELGLAQAHRWQIILGDSAKMVPALLASEELNGPTLWWLDAHFPARYKGDDVEWLPLVAEVQAIVESERDHSGDVFLLDDMRVYGAKAQAGPLPDLPGLKRGAVTEMAAIVDALGATHVVRLDHRDGCYLIALPREEPPLYPRIPVADGAATIPAAEARRSAAAVRGSSREDWYGR